MKTYSHILACGLSLVLLPCAFANADKKFEMMDANGDGKISRAEHKDGARQMFSEVDTNNDGVITAMEMDTHLYNQKSDRGGQKMSGRDKIRKVDRNSDGRLTRSEHAAGSETMFGQMDTNRDDSLSREELEAGHEAMSSDRNS